MEFDKLFEKYMAGECTEIEKEFVECEIAKAQRVTDALINHQSVAYRPVEDDQVVRAQKRFNNRILLRILIITSSMLLLIAGITLGIIFGPAVANAKANENLTRQEAMDIALNYATEYASENGLNIGNTSDIIVKDSDKDLEWVSPRRNSVYSYDFELIVGNAELDVVVSAATGSVRISDMDYHGLR